MKARRLREQARAVADLGVDVPNTTCTVEGCDRERRSPGSAMCGLHYDRVRKHGSTAKPPGRRRVAECVIDGCTKPPARSSRMCSMHYARKRRHGSPHVVKYGVEPPKTYRHAHKRLESARGRAESYRCVDCGGQAQEWSYDHRDPDEEVTAGGVPWSKDLSRYEPRCKACHTVFDRRDTCDVPQTVEG